MPPAVPPIPERPERGERRARSGLDDSLLDRADEPLRERVGDPARDRLDEPLRERLTDSRRARMNELLRDRLGEPVGEPSLRITTPRPVRTAPISFRGRDGAPSAPRMTPQPSSTTSGLGPAAPPPRAGTADPAAPTRESLQRPQIGTYLSPRMTAIFGGIFGLATVTSIIALLIQVVPPRDERSLLASMPGLSPSGAASVAVAPARAVIVRPKRIAIPGPWRISDLEKDPTVVISSGTMDRRAFIDALAEKGVQKAQSYRIMKALDGVRKFDKTGKKDKFIVAVDRASQRVRAFEYEVSPSEIYQAREGADGILAGSRLDMKIAESEFAGSFYVSGNITESYRAGGFEDGILAAIDEALTGRLSTESFEEGGTVRIIATEETALGLFSRYKRLVAIEYRPPDPAAKPTRMYAFEGPSSHGYFDEKGKQPYAGGWRSPIPGAPVTSRFNPKRMHPVLHKIMPHQGTDFGAPMGTPVYSAYRGVVESVGPGGPAGNLVTINHPNGVTTGYAHLSRFAPGIKPGDKVGVHQLVGFVGTTGRSTGPHLHFSAKRDGKFFDAETLLLESERVMPPSDRPAFSAAKADLDARLDAIALPEPPPAPPPQAMKVAAAAGSGAPAAGACRASFAHTRFGAWSRRDGPPRRGRREFARACGARGGGRAGDPSFSIRRRCVGERRRRARRRRAGPRWSASFWASRPSRWSAARRPAPPDEPDEDDSAH